MALEGMQCYVMEGHGIFLPHFMWSHSDEVSVMARPKRRADFFCTGVCTFHKKYSECLMLLLHSLTGTKLKAADPGRLPVGINDSINTAFLL